MAVTLEQVEKLRARSGASYTDCKDALDRSGGDLLEALLDLERQGKSSTAGAGGFYSTRPGTLVPPAGRTAGGSGAAADKGAGKTGPSFERPLRSVWEAFLNIFRHASANRLDIWRQGVLFSSVPVAALILLTVAAFWITAALLVVGLFLGCRYRFSGPDVKWDAINDVLENISDGVGDITERVKAKIHKNTAKK